MNALISAVRQALEEQGNPAKAGPMQAYMKSAMPYRGVTSPVQRALYKELFAAHPLADADAWQSTALELWREARFREERYAAIALTGAKRYDAYQTLDRLPMYEEMITTGAWWDYVDEIATHRIALLLRRFPGPMRSTMRAWSRCDDPWKRRSSIICQVSFKADTDLRLLYACIEPSLAERGFFLRKAIGWALRAYAWTDPDEIVRYVQEHEAELSGLSKREALKNVTSPGRRGPTRPRPAGSSAPRPSSRRRTR
jgi:3-methyladenine DNA glycosylase AlkD